MLESDIVLQILLGKAYRWQYVHSGAGHPHFGKVFTRLITKEQGERIQSALATLR